MNDEEFLQQASESSPAITELPTAEQTEATTQLEERTAITDKSGQQEEERKEQKERNWNPLSAEFWVGSGAEGNYGWSSPNQSIRDTQVGAELEGFATDPKSAAEYYLAPGAGVVDTAIGAYNVIAPGVDIPQLPQFENKGAQLVRDVSSLFIPGSYGAKGVDKGAKLAQGLGGRLGAFSRDPFVKYVGTNSAKLGVAAFTDLAAPVQGAPDSQTLLGTIHDFSPRHLGWIPEDLRVVEGDGPDTIRRKNLQEGTAMGALGLMLQGVARILRGRSGLKRATEWIPENEKASSYFSANKSQVDDTVEELLDNGSFRREVDLDEVGQYNVYKEMQNGYDVDDAIIFGRDTELYSFAEQGLRSADDMGIVGASVDLARINNSVDTIYGRVRNPVSQAALSYSLDQPGGVMRIVNGLSDELAAAGQYGYRTETGKLVTSKAINNSVDELAARMLDMPRKELQKLLDEFSSVKEGLPVLNKQGGKAVKKAIEDALVMVADANKLRTAALLDTSFAGQAADMAWGMRIYEGGEASLRLQEQLIDRIEFLQTLRGTTAYSRNQLVRNRSTWSRLTGVSQMTPAEKYSRAISDKMGAAGGDMDFLKALELIQEDSRQFGMTLRAIANERPNFLKPMALAYEMTDGDARSMAYLNNFLRQKTGVLSKAFIDGQPEIPSTIMQGFFSIGFNSALSGIYTPIKAGVSNFSAWVFRPTAEFAGAYMQGDRARINRAMFAYSATMDTFTSNFDYAKRMFVKSGQDPNALRGRDELVYKTDKDMDLFKSAADGAEAEGNLGPSALYDIMKTQKDLAEHPWLRIGNRAMLFSDAWLTNSNAQFVAKLRAWDEITEYGTKPLKEADALALSEKIYKEMFDDNGIIKDMTTLDMTAKQAFSQDNALSKGFQDMMQRIPGMKPFFRFTRSPVNSVSYAASFQPVGAFIDKTKKFSKPIEEMPMQKVERLLMEEGVDLTKADPVAEYTRLRNEYKGRSALGVSFVMMAAYGYLSGNITGRAGLYDTEKQKIRVKNGWKPMTAFGIDYSAIPAVSDWVGGLIDIFDNTFEMDQFDAGELMRAYAYVLGANILDRTQLQNVEQFSDVLKGNPAAINRWIANTTFESTTLVSGMLGNMNKLMSPQLKAVEQRFDQLLLNRIPGKPGLPDDYDPIEGGRVGFVENPVIRLYNALSPFKYSEKPSEAQQYLIDVEFNVELGMTSRTDGVKYTKAELAEIKRLMGEDGGFKRDILALRKRFPADKFRADFNNARNLNPNLGTFQNLHALLADAQERAKARAESKLPELMRKKREEGFRQKGTEAYLRSGDLEGAQRFVEESRQRGLY